MSLTQRLRESAKAQRLRARASAAMLSGSRIGGLSYWRACSSNARCKPSYWVFTSSMKDEGGVDMLMRCLETTAASVQQRSANAAALVSVTRRMRKQEKQTATPLADSAGVARAVGGRSRALAAHRRRREAVGGQHGPGHVLKRKKFCGFPQVLSCVADMYMCMLYGVRICFPSR